MQAFGQSGNIAGKLTDKDNAPVQYASVYLIRASDSSAVKAAVSSEDGAFMLVNLPISNYLMRISTIGYLEKWIRIELNETKPSVNLGVIRMTESGKNLREVQIEAERKLLENSIDKKTFQVDKSIISQSGSAVDALQQLPNVTTDENGNLQLRGAEGILILINGKPTGITGANLQTVLNQIPANSIEKIEVITNPSSKYDAEGANGIINIILKRNRNVGINGNVNLQAGTRDKYNLGAGLSYNKGKLGLSATYGLRMNMMRWKGSLERQVRNSDTTFYFDTYNHGTNHMLSQAVSLNADYYFNKFNTLSLTGSGTFGGSRNPEWIKYVESDLNRMASSVFTRHNDIRSNNRFLNVNAQYRKTYDKSAKDLSVSGNYTNGSDTMLLDGRNFYSLSNYLPSGRIAQIRQNRNRVFNQNALLQLDFLQPLKHDRKLELGAKSTYRSIDNEMRISNADSVSENYTLDSSLSNRFYYSEIINAGYVNFSGIYKDIGFQIGTRVEQTLADGELKYTGKPVGYSRLDFFPGFYLVKKIKKVHEWKLNYTRRIERPSAGQLNPFNDLSDPRNIRRGNPDLKPQFINSFELEYTFSNKKWTSNPGLYYKQTNNLIWRYITIEEGINYVSFENIGNSYNIGLDWVTTFAPAKWLNTLTSINVYNNRMKGQLGTFVFDNSNVMANIKQTLNFKVKKMADVQCTYNYRSPFLTPQGQGITMHWMDLGITVPVLKAKGTFTLTLSDVFDTRQFGIDLELPGVEQTFMRKMETRILYAGFNYRFGKQSSTPKPRKKDNQEPRNEDVGF